MKLFEDMDEMGGSINDVIQKIVNELFHEELDDDDIEEIVNDLSLSDIINLDNAYTDGDKESIRDILGPLPQLDEYSMGQGRKATSSAASRPAPTRKEPAGGEKKSGGSNGVQTNRNYSGGVQTTQNIDGSDEVDDPDAVMKDEEPVDEANSGSFDNERFNSQEVVRALEAAAEDENEDDPMFSAGLQMVANRINQSYPDSITIPDIMNMLNEPQLRGVRKEDIEYALMAAGIMDFMESKDNNVIEMVEWLKKRAGIA